MTFIYEKRPWVKVIAHTFVMENNSLKYYPYPTSEQGVLARTRTLGMRALYLDQIYGSGPDFSYVYTVALMLEIWPWNKIMTHPYARDNNYVKNLYNVSICHCCYLA